LGFRKRSKLASTSRAVTGVPSWNVASGRSVMRAVVGVISSGSPAASCGTISYGAVGDRPYSPS
jgi:hypothetical protein